MTRKPCARSGLAALRPWPFGPPLRGRVPRGEAGAPAAHGLASPARLSLASYTHAGRQATVPVGDGAWIHPLYCAS